VKQGALRKGEGEYVKGKTNTNSTVQHQKKKAGKKQKKRKRGKKCRAIPGG